MAAGYFPSIYDTTKSQEMWSFLRPNLRQVRTPQTSSMRQSGSGTGFVDPRRPAAQGVEPPAVCRIPNLPKVPEYRHLEVFSAAEEDGGPAASSEADEISELCIKVKEFELCEMMEGTSKIPPSK